MKTFRIGGIHPSENKLSAGLPILTLPIPSEVVIPLSQHIGIPAKLCVERGDLLKVGTLIAQAEGFVSAAICSPVSGIVNKIDKVIDSSGYPKPAVFIDVRGDEWEEHIDRSDTLIRDCILPSSEIIQKIMKAGVVGMGGATFPTHVKLSPPPGTKVEILIVNAVECEPYLTADHALMLEKPDEILVGITLLMKALEISHAVIGIENNKKDAIRLFTSKCETEYPEIEIRSLQTRYPQGGEKQLIEAITGRRVRSGELPVSTGAVVHNVATVFAVYEAVQKNKPLIERVVTVTGKQLLNPANMRVRIGTPMSVLIDEIGGIPEDTGKIISGGPMMGRALISLDVPVTKGSSGILLMPREESSRGTVFPCVRCAKCVSVCPMGLEPYLMASLSMHGEFQQLEHESVMDCIECGCCQYTCPSHRPLLDYCRLGKSKVGAMLRSRKK